MRGQWLVEGHWGGHSARIFLVVMGEGVWSVYVLETAKRVVK